MLNYGHETTGLLSTYICQGKMRTYMLVITVKVTKVIPGEIITLSMMEKKKGERQAFVENLSERPVGFEHLKIRRDRDL